MRCGGDDLLIDGMLVDTRGGKAGWSIFDVGGCFSGLESLFLDDFDVSDDELDVRLEDNFSSGRLFSLDTILLVNTEVA